MKCSRDIACIFYLTKSWRHSDGGVLIDRQGPGGDREFVPEFNSAMLFRVPRLHAVRDHLHWLLLWPRAQAHAHRTPLAVGHARLHLLGGCRLLSATWP